MEEMLKYLHDYDLAVGEFKNLPKELPHNQIISMPRDCVKRFRDGFSLLNHFAAVMLRCSVDEVTPYAITLYLREFYRLNPEEPRTQRDKDFAVEIGYEAGKERYNKSWGKLWRRIATIGRRKG